MTEVDDSPANIERIIERVLSNWLGNHELAGDIADYVMGLLEDYEWGPTHGHQD